MKTTFATLCLVFCALFSFGQSFEGMVTYYSSYKSRLKGYPDQHLADIAGTISKFYIKNGDYKTETNGYQQAQYYIAKENKIYNKVSDSDVLGWHDASKSPEKVTKIELNKNKMEILGYMCDELILTCTSGIQKYYFSAQLPLDPELFEQDKYQNWYAYVSKAKAVPLKIIYEQPSYTTETIATEVKAMPLDSTVFTLPAGTTIEKKAF